ncbi:MAG: methyl-accepting chemotaxis protein, partial [Clostridiales bacterium]|nr:methyl-accepting chemotaxis protein [Clostridiales bacterium]
RRRNISIKAKLVGVILPGIILIVIGMVGLAYGNAKKIIAEDAKNQLEVSANLQGTKISSWLNENLATFSTYKKTIETLQYSSVFFRSIMNETYGVNEDYPEGVYIGDSYQALMKADQSKKSDKDMLNAPWYKEGIEHTDMQVGNAYQNESSEWVISATGTIKEDSKTTRVFAADMPLSRINTIVNSVVGMDGAEIFLVNLADHMFLTYPDNSRIGTILTEADSDSYLQKVERRLVSNDYAFREIEGKMTVFTKIEGTNWMLVSYIPTNIVYAELNRLRTQLIVLALVCVIALIILTERSIHVIVKPIKTLTNTISRMSEGDFTVTIEEKGRDEISNVMSSVKQFLVSMQKMFQGIYQVSERLNEQAENSHRISQDMYDASRTQSTSMGELNSTMDQLTVSVNEVAESATTLAEAASMAKQNSGQVSEQMRETIMISEKGQADMEKVSTAMEQIRTSIASLETAVNKVGISSEKITGIVHMIASISEETNLLSLNASIEAARAGESGKGFAIVAAEIGKLAQSSQGAANEIAALIEEIRNLVSDAVDKAKGSTIDVGDSADLIHDSVSTFHQIFGTIHNTNELMNHMIDMVNQVDDVASTLAAITQEQAASSDEVAATSQNMVEQAEKITRNSQLVAEDAKSLKLTSNQLNEQMKHFKI